jgi:N-methylhydantoinase A
VPDPAAPGDLRAAFDHRCLEAYSFRLDAPLEIVSLRVTATAPPGPPIAWHGDAPGGSAPPHAERLVDLDPHGGLTVVPVVSRAGLAAEEVLTGPCVVEEAAATTLVLPGQSVRCDSTGNLVVEERG